MEKPRLLDQLRHTIRTKHYSIRTEDAYVYWAKEFILFHKKRHPKDMSEEEINQFLTHLAVRRNVAASTQNQALCAILFLYREILKRDIGWLDDVEKAKKPRKLPVVFSKREVKAMLTELEGKKWLMAILLYGSGLRLMECLRLRVKDVDYDIRTVQELLGHKDVSTTMIYPAWIPSGHSCA